jgi:hypothetical protein
VRLVVSNAIRFYAATPEQQQAMAAATSRAFEYYPGKEVPHAAAY